MEKIQKRSRPPQGYYKILENAAIARDRKICDRNPDVLGIYQAERIVAKKIHNGKALFMVNWHGYCPSENTWEPKVRLPPELLEALWNSDPDLVRVEEARERIGLTFERGMKVPLQHEEPIEICHDVVRFLFPNAPAQLQQKPTEINDRELEDAGLGPYIERTINANGNRCRIAQLTLWLLLSK